MDDDADPVLVQVRADASQFRREVAALKAEMTEVLGRGADAAGRGIATALSRAARSGRLEFEDLARVAARAMGAIAASALKLGPGAAQPVGAGLGSLLQGGLSALLGLPGRATGGPVAPGAAYVVGERGPELFVPTASGRVTPMEGAPRGSVNVTVHVHAASVAQPNQMLRSGRQIAREVARVLDRVRD